MIVSRLGSHRRRFSPQQGAEEHENFLLEPGGGMHTDAQTQNKEKLCS